jgi:hypothetical protein
MSNEQEQPSGSEPTAERGRGWSSDEVVRDHGDKVEGEEGWSGDEVVRDQGEDSEPK